LGAAVGQPGRYAAGVTGSTIHNFRSYLKNAIRILEAKSVRDLGTSTVRGEFGKAHDLRVNAYLIWSFYSPPERVVAGANPNASKLRS
jgi:hypothetical protein